MTEEELRMTNPDLYEQIMSDAARSERERQRGLDSMIVQDCPQLVTLIEKARSKGQTPAEIAMEANATLREHYTSGEFLTKLKRDAAPASGVPASDAPFQSGRTADYQKPKLKATVNGRKRR